MIIKDIYKKIHINPFFYLLAILSILTGLFKEFIIMYLIIFIHEFGHIFFAIIFNYEIIKINIYPFGGYTIFNYDINSKFINEFLLFLGGILFQFILLLIIHYTVDNYSYFYKLFINYNTNILIFNLLPIYSLDGGKLLNMILNKLLPFKISHLLSIYISYILILILTIIFYKDINIILISILLITLTIKEYKIHKFIFNKFLIERYIKKLSFKHNNFILGNKIHKMKKYLNNIFIINNEYLTEYEILKNRFYY